MAAESKVEHPGQKALELLEKEEKVSTIVLVGKHEIGKTWMAKKISGQAISKGLVDTVLWAYLDKMYDDKTIHESFARQMSMYSTTKEGGNGDKEEVLEGVVEKDPNILREKIYATLADRSLLLVLDSEGIKMNESDLMKLLCFPKSPRVKKLITTTNEGGWHDIAAAKEEVIVIEVPPLSREDKLSLLRQRAGTEVYEIPEVKALAEKFIDQNVDLTPVAIVMLAKALSYRGHGSAAVQVLEDALEESKNYSFKQLLRSGYDKVPDGVLIDCSCEGSHFFRDRGSVHFIELIAYWIIEGYLGDIDSIDKAYEEGHRVLMELIHCQILKKVEENVKGNHLRMERAELSLDDHYRGGFGSTATLGLAKVFKVGEWDGIGEITQANGMMKSVPRSNKKELSTLLLDGNHFSREVSTNFLQSMNLLQVLVLFNPGLSSVQSLSSMNMLKVLVLRGCDLLAHIEDLEKLTDLSVLEISGAKSLKKIPDVFHHMTKLRSLNLSAPQIEELPASFYGLTELRWLILKGCSCLKEMQSLKKFEKLLVLNLSGATSLEKFPEKNVKALEKLETLDLSNTSIKSIPILRGIRALTHLSASDCHGVERLRSIQSLTNLQVLDLSGSSIEEFRDQSFNSNDKLRILDLSRTEISWLPSNLSDPRQLYLKGCLRLTELPFIDSLKSLEALDLSGASNLEKINDKFFQNLKKLRVLNLSETKVKDLPPLSTLCNLRQLLLSGCLSLKTLPTLDSLSKLEVLDLSGCNALTVIKDKSFEQMSHLQRLTLSATKIEKLPSLSKLGNLRHLSLRKCTNLKLEVPLNFPSCLEALNLCGISSLTRADFLEHMGHLRVLDLSETELEQLPPLSNLKNLVHLSLRGCEKLETLPLLEEHTKLEILDLSGTRVKPMPSLTKLSNLHQFLPSNCLSSEEIKNLPYEISELTQLEQSHQTDMGVLGAGSGKGQSLPEEQWGISTLPVPYSNSHRPFISLSNSEFFQRLEKEPQLWETSFKQFQFSVHPMEEQTEIRGIELYKDKSIFRDLQFQARYFSDLREQGKSLEIHDFGNFPKGIEVVLSRSEYVFLIHNSFIKSLCDLGANNIKVMRGCGIERCTNMESIFHVEKEEIDTTLEILWVSYAIKLSSIYSGDLQYVGFRNLKRLYLDCCPELPCVFSKSQRPESLEILHIKFCDKLENLFELEEMSKECILPKLRELLLCGLPALKKIECELPALKSLEVRECPMFANDLFLPKLPTTLETLKIKFCHKLETLFEPETSANNTLSSLHTLHLWGLPKLRSIQAEMPSLQHPIVKQCPKLQMRLASQSGPPVLNT
ncbi:unnamed protein product [Ilex paraguariensis]|uniref:NB-ARC domain-containing protein n=1 Tax=Ilex paraguariensis TaxID=185542 RepID=A0ABC8TUW1_9AQUA